MNFHLLLVLLLMILIVPAYGQETKNPSVVIETIEIPDNEFNRISRDAPIYDLENVHAISWQVTINNNLLYDNPNGNAVLRIYDNQNSEKFIEIGMGSPPAHKFWIAAQIPDDEGYVIVHKKLERGWFTSAKSIISYTDRAGLTVNNGERIEVSNLDIGVFAINSYSVFGMEGSTDPPAINSGSVIVEFLSGDPAKNVFAFFPFYVAAGVGVLVGVLYLTKKRS